MTLPILPKEVYPILAWRAFKYYTPGYLGDVGGSHVYEPKRPWESSCRVNEFRAQKDAPLVDHIAPGEECTCGFWAFKDKEQIVRQGYNGHGLIGEVWLWGRVIECEDGYRSQYMYVNSLFVTKKHIEAEAPWLGYIYGVPCDVDLPFGARNWYKEHPPVYTDRRPARPMSRLPYRLSDLWKIVLESEDYYLRRDARNRLRGRLVNELTSKSRVVRRCERIIVSYGDRIRHINNGLATLDRVLRQLNQQRSKMRKHK